MLTEEDADDAGLKFLCSLAEHSLVTLKVLEEELVVWLHGDGCPDGGIVDANITVHDIHRLFIDRVHGSNSVCLIGELYMSKPTSRAVGFVC